MKRREESRKVDVRDHQIFTSFSLTRIRRVFFFRADMTIPRKRDGEELEVSRESRTVLLDPVIDDER